jgi:protein arginine N-methyltransferase 1
VSHVLDEHRKYLADRARVDGYAAALAELVRPGMAVADVASGTGFLGLLACRAGAARVYSIEVGPIAAVARAIAQANGFGDRLQVIRGHSARLQLPEPVDVVVSDQIGRFGFEAGLLELAAEARARFLKPSGILVPSALDLIVAPVEDRDQSERVAFWSQRPAQFDLSAAQPMASNMDYPVQLTADQMLSDPQAGCRIDLSSDHRGPLRIDRRFTVSRQGTLDGIAGWFSARLSPGVSITNSPLDRDRIARRQTFFPIGTPTVVAPGDRVDVRMQILPADLIVSWRVVVEARGRPPVRFSHSTLAGMLLDRDTLAMTDPVYRPALSEHGRARRFVLELCDGARALRDIEAEVYQRHRALFATRDAAAVFVGEVITRDTRHAP